MINLVDTTFASKCSEKNHINIFEKKKFENLAIV